MSTAPYLAVAALCLAAASPLLAAPTQARGEEKLAKLLAGATPGKAQSCMSTFPQRDSQTIDGIGIVYREGKTWWLNRFEGGCPQLTSSTAIVTRTSMTQLCRGDIARVVDPGVGMELGSCVFSDFVPYTKPK